MRGTSRLIGMGLAPLVAALLAAGGGVGLGGGAAGGRPEGAAEAIQTLAREREAAAVIGPAGIPEARAAAREAGRRRIPLFTLTAPEELLDPPRPWVFSTAVPASLGARAILPPMT